MAREMTDRKRARGREQDARHPGKESLDGEASREVTESTPSLKYEMNNSHW